MKKTLLLILISACALIKVGATGFSIQNYYGVNCLVHTFSNNETFYQVARRYFVRPSTLAIVNNIQETESIEVGKRLYVPLTETNFFTTKGLESSKFSFRSVFYKIQREKTLVDLANVFFINPANLAEWNKKDMNSSVDQGDRYIVGWVKYEKDLKIASAPAYIQKEKIVFGNISERAEAREFLLSSNKKRKEQTLNQTVQVANKETRANVSSDIVVKEKEPKIEITKKKVETKKIVVAREVKVEKKATIKKTEGEKKPKSIDVEKKPKIVKRIDKESLTKKEKEFLALSNKNKKKKESKGAFIKKIKGLTNNSYSREKSKSNTEIKKLTPIVKRDTVLVRKEIISDSIKEPKKSSAKVNFVKNNATEVKKELLEVNQPSDKPLFLENKLQRLTLLKSTRGKASFFYSGTAGAKFYVFTNLAKKGGVIKVTNTSNKRFILAEVVEALPEVDRRKGYIIKLSDNSKLILGTKAKSFMAKVNY